MISVIVPVYNLENYIEKTLKSVVNQTYKDIEIVAVDDGSTDNSAEILDHLAEQYSNLKVIHKINEGVTNARLAGIQAAKGEWIGFVDGDDIIDANMYERLLNNAEKYHVQISHCGYQMVFGDGRINYFYNTGDLILQDKIKGVKDLLEGIYVEPGLWNKLFSRSLFDDFMKQDLMDKSIKINEDLLMNYYLFLKSECSVYEDFCPYHYMVRANSASRSKMNKNKIYDPIKVKKIICDSAPNEINNIAKKAYISTCINVYNTLAINKGYTKEKKNVYKYIYKEKPSFYLLDKKSKLLAKLICQVPVLYPLIYGIYVHYFQKKKYD